MKKLNEILEDNELVDNLKDYIKIPLHWILARKIDKNKIREGDFIPKYYKQLKANPNHKCNKIEEKCLSVNQLNNNYDNIKNNYIELFSPMYKKFIFVFQVYPETGLIKMDDKANKHCNIYLFEQLNLNEIYKNEIIHGDEL